MYRLQRNTESRTVVVVRSRRGLEVGRGYVTASVCKADDDQSMCNFNSRCAALGRRGRYSGRAFAVHTVRVVGRIHWSLRKGKGCELEECPTERVRAHERGGKSEGLQQEGKRLAGRDDKVQGMCGQILVAWDRILCLLLFIKTATAQELPIPNLVDGSVYLPDLV